MNHASDDMGFRQRLERGNRLGWDAAQATKIVTTAYLHYCRPAKMCQIAGKY